LMLVDSSSIWMRDQKGKLAIDYALEGKLDPKSIVAIRREMQKQTIAAFGGTFVKRNFLYVSCLVSLLIWQVAVMFAPFWVVCLIGLWLFFYVWPLVKRDVTYRNKCYAAFWAFTNFLVFCTEWFVLVPEFAFEEPFNMIIIAIGYPYLVYGFYKLVTIPPQYLQRKPEDIPAIYQYCTTIQDENFSYSTSGKWCPTCLVARPPLSKHCIICHKCISTFDHHCYWIDACVGEGNHRTFFIFIWVFSVGIWATIRFFYLHLVLSPVVSSGDGWFEQSVLAYVHHPWYWSLLMSMVLFTPFMATTALSQLYCVSIGITLAELATREYKKRSDVNTNPFRSSSITNIVEFLKGNPRNPQFQPEVHE